MLNVWPETISLQVYVNKCFISIKAAVAVYNRDNSPVLMTMSKKLQNDAQLKNADTPFISSILTSEELYRWLKLKPNHNYTFAKKKKKCKRFFCRFY